MTKYLIYVIMVYFAFTKCVKVKLLAKDGTYKDILTFSPFIINKEY